MENNNKPKQRTSLKLSFGRYAGKCISKVPQWYRIWLYNHCTTLEESDRFIICQYIPGEVYKPRIIPTREVKF